MDDAEAEAERHSQELARLGVADAARREWREATAAREAAARAARTELQRRGLAERIPVTDAEVAETSAEPRELPVIDPADAARWKAGQKAGLDAYRQAQRERWGREIPVTDAELEAAQAAGRSGAGAETHEAERAEREVSPERAADEANLAEIRAELDRFGELIDQIPDREAERQARREEIDAEPGIRPEPGAEPALESSWQPGEASSRTGVEADADFEMEI